MARLLVVDDEEDIRQFLAEYLADQGEENHRLEAPLQTHF